MALWQRVRGPARAAMLVLASCLAALVAFDVLAYFFLPASLTTFAPDYRQQQPYRLLPPEARLGMQGYYRADPVLGFDIVPNQQGGHILYIPGAGSAPFASNDLGCRDPRNLADLRQMGGGGGGYIYFAGDSFTMGHVRETHGFPRVYERASGNPSLNCGVGATGQRHQLEKFRRTVRAIGRYPRLVVIGLFVNDMVDDVWYPGITIISHGFLVSLHRHVHRPGARGLALAGKEPAAQEWISWFWRTRDVEREYEEWRRRQERLKNPSPTQRFHHWRWKAQKRYSLLYNLWRPVPKPKKPNTASLPTDPVAALMLRYRQNPYNRSHREALRVWAHHAKEHGYRLAAVLIPAKSLLGSRRSRDWRAEVRGYLTSLDVPVLDFADHIEAEGLRVQDLYWQYDGHLDENGNRILGEWLARELP